MVNSRKRGSREFHRRHFHHHCRFRVWDCGILDCAFSVNFHRHVLTLAKRYGIAVKQTARTEEECLAWKRARKVQILPVSNYRTYILALHELAHVIFPVPVLTLDREIQAWKGARKIAAFWTREANSVARECLVSYLEFYKGDKRVRVSRMAREYIAKVLQA